MTIERCPGCGAECWPAHSTTSTPTYRRAEWFECDKCHYHSPTAEGFDVAVDFHNRLCCDKHVGTKYDDGLCQDCVAEAQKEEDNG